jgi:hypothetical protein
MNACKILVGKADEIRSLGRQRRRWVDNIKKGLKDIEWGSIEWIDVAQDRGQWRAVVNTVMNLRVSLNTGKFWSSCTTGGFSRKVQLHDVNTVLLDVP